MELLTRLMDELEVTREQAEGGAGSLLQLAQTRLEPEQFVRVADAIPGVSDIVAKAPRFESAAGGLLRFKVSRLLGGLGGLGPLTRPFARLKLDRLAIRRFVAVLVRYFGEEGGPEVAKLLAAVWR